MQIGILKCTEEPLVALVPKVAAKLKKAGYEIVLEKGAGKLAYFEDEEYQAVEVEARDQSARFTYSSVSVLIITAVSPVMCGGTITRRPFSRVAGL